jgi:capsular polysaccharide biosynthesis protein
VGKLLKVPGLSDLFKKVFKRLAWWASYILQPLMIFRWTGILAYRTISYRKFSPIPFRPDAQGTMGDQKPRSTCNSQIWTITPPSDLVISHVLEIKGGIADRLGNVFDPLTGKLISGAAHKYRYKVKRAYIPRPHRLYPHVERLSGEVAVFTASNQHIYWHWLLDVMPRLIMLEEMGRRPQTLYIQKKFPFQHEMLEYMGVLSKQRIIDCDQFPMISASTLHVPCHQIMEGREFPKWVCQALQKKFFPFAKKIKAVSKGRIYISRAGSSQRRIANEEKLLPVLLDYGFQVVKLEELTFGEQIGLFNEADVVVSPNGSGLANLVFCSKGTTVIEIFPNVIEVLNSVDYTFNFDYNYRLARSLDLPYYFVCGSNGESNTQRSSDYFLMSEDLFRIFDLAKIPMSK